MVDGQNNDVMSNTGQVVIDNIAESARNNIDCEDLINHVKAAAKQDMSNINNVLSKQQIQIDSLVESVKTFVGAISNPTYLPNVPDGTQQSSTENLQKESLTPLSMQKGNNVPDGTLPTQAAEVSNEYSVSIQGSNFWFGNNDKATSSQSDGDEDQTSGRVEETIQSDQSYWQHMLDEYEDDSKATGQKSPRL